ncbi:uncharacterized protein LOC8024298 [Ixodes scapularis]|nr:uncharacterized protein LOC8024298 [Ixodes scapularis]
MASRHRSLPPSRREKKRADGLPIADTDVPEWLDVIQFGHVGPIRDVFKTIPEDKSAVPSCYESGDSTSLSSSDNASEGGKDGLLKDPGRYSFRSTEGGGNDEGVRITHMCMARRGSVRSTGFEAGEIVVEANDDDLPEIFVTADSRRSPDGENDGGCGIGRESLRASLPKDLLRVPQSRKGRMVVSSSRKGGRKKTFQVSEVRRAPSDSADSGIYTSFGKDIRSYGLPEEQPEPTNAEREMSLSEQEVAATSDVQAASPPTTPRESGRSSPMSTAQLEAERRRRQRNTELATIFIFVPVLIAWVLIVPLVLFSYSFENPYSKQFQVALWICIPVSTLVLSFTCLLSNVYWYYDQESGRWRYLLHCGKGPAGFYFGDVLSDTVGGARKSAMVEVV